MASPGEQVREVTGVRGLLGRAVSSVHLPFATVGAVALFGFLWIALQHWRVGALLVGMALLVATGLRAALPTARVGLLAIRSRRVDLVLYGGFGLLIVAVAATIQRAPFG